MKKRSTKLKWLGLTLASLGAVVSSGVMAAEANNMQAESRGGIKIFNAADDSFWFSIGGRLNFDETFFAGGQQDKQSDYPTGGNIRRGLLKFAGGVGEYLTYNLTMNFDGSNARFEDAWINACSEYTGAINQADLRFGQFTPPVSIDAWGSQGTVNDNVFLEPALATTAFSIPTKVYGVWADASALDMFVLSAAAYHPKNDLTDTVTSSNFNNTGRSDRLGGNVRLTFVPIHTEDTVFHVGAVGRYQAVNNATSGGVATYQPALFSTRPEALARNTSALVNTGGTSGTASSTGIRARSYNIATAEALAIMGPAFIEGEYYHANVQRVPTITDARTAGNPRFHGWHVEGGYMLTGESRGYDFMSGTLRNPKPANSCGAWEIAARYSYINLNSNNSIYGGSEHNTTIGVNWFVNENVRVAANYIRANIRPTGTATVNGIANVPTGQPVTAPAGTQPVVKRQLDIFGVRFSVVF